MEVKVRNYRINTISKFDGVKEEIYQESSSCGLALERRTEDGHYIVVAFVKPTYDDVVIEPVGTRLLDVEPYEWEYVRELLKVAVQAIMCINNWGSDNE